MNKDHMIRTMEDYGLWDAQGVEGLAYNRNPLVDLREYGTRVATHKVYSAPTYDVNRYFAHIKQIISALTKLDQDVAFYEYTYHHQLDNAYNKLTARQIAEILQITKGMFYRKRYYLWVKVHKGLKEYIDN